MHSQRWEQVHVQHRTNMHMCRPFKNMQRSLTVKGHGHKIATHSSSKLAVESVEGVQGVQQ